MNKEIKQFAQKIFSNHQDDITLGPQFTQYIKNINDQYSMMTKKPNRGEANINTGSKYAEYNQIKNAFGKPIDPPNPKESLLSFLERAGFIHFEGSSFDKVLSMYQEMIRENHCKKIFEIGFNRGLSSEYFLEASPDTEVVSLDIMLHGYCTYAKMYIDAKFPDRHLLLAGSSDNSLVAFKKINPNYVADFILIDGSHTLSGAYYDILYCKEIADENTILIIDNITPHQGVGVEVYDALLQHIHEGNVILETHYSITTKKQTYKDGFAIGRYVFNKKNTILPENESQQNIEHYVPCFILSSIIDQLNQLYEKTKNKNFLLSSEDITTLDHMIENDKLLPEIDQQFDSYIIYLLNKHKKLIQLSKNKNKYKPNNYRKKK